MKEIKLDPNDLWRLRVLHASKSPDFFLAFSFSDLEEFIDSEQKIIEKYSSRPHIRVDLEKGVIVFND